MAAMAVPYDTHPNSRCGAMVTERVIPRGELLLPLLLLGVLSFDLRGCGDAGPSSGSASDGFGAAPWTAGSDSNDSSSGGGGGSSERHSAQTVGGAETQ